MRPGKRMPEGGVLTGSKLVEINHVLRQQVLIFPRQPNIMQSGIVGADRDIDTGLVASLEHCP